MLITARDVIPRTRPDFVILTGICYGLRRDEGQMEGDVIVARRVQNIDQRKVTADAIIARGVNAGCSPILLDRFQTGQSTWAASRVHFGTVLTSSTLVDSPALVEDLRSQFPDATAGEMEGSGVYEASTRPPKPDWILVKAISDWGSGKTDQLQPFAARTAAEFVIHVIAAGLLRHPHRNATGSDPTSSGGPWSETQLDEVTDPRFNPPPTGTHQS